MGRLILELTALMLLGATALPAQACINDREVNRAEREFKSQYLKPAPATQPAPDPSGIQGQALPITFLGSGGLLLLGAMATVLNLHKRPGGE